VSQDIIQALATLIRRYIGDDTQQSRGREKFIDWSRAHSEKQTARVGGPCGD